VSWRHISVEVGGAPLAAESVKCVPFAERQASPAACVPAGQPAVDEVLGNLQIVAKSRLPRRISCRSMAVSDNAGSGVPLSWPRLVIWASTHVLLRAASNCLIGPTEGIIRLGEFPAR